MSYTELDAWIDEKSQGDWPFERWRLPHMELRTDFDYFKRVPFGDLIDRLQRALHLNNRNRASLAGILGKATRAVDEAIDYCEAEARSAWSSGAAWLAPIGETIYGVDFPARMLIDSIAVIDEQRQFDESSEIELCGAVGLWCLGENDFHRRTGDYSAAFIDLEQAGLALSQAEWLRGQAAERAGVSYRNKNAANAGHAQNKKKKLHGFGLWTSREWKPQAAAERAIAAECHITKEVAGRWIREFKRSPEAYLALQSKYSAAQRP